MKNFTRLDLAKELALKTNVPTTAARQTMEAVFGILADKLVDGQTVEFRGFGIFEAYTRKPKVGRNPRRPQDGPYLVPARRVVRFRCGKLLDDRLNGTSADKHEAANL